MNIREKTKKIEEIRKKYELGGGLNAIKQVHKKGKLTGRERIERFVDSGSFREFNLWAQPTRTGFNIDNKECPGDAIVSGFARVDKRPICIYAHDFTVMGGSQASVQYWKACRVINTSVKLGIPYVGIIDSGGVRIQDAFGINAGTGISRNADVWYSPAVASGVVPSISLTLGASYAGTAYSPFLADVFFMVKKSYCNMSLASPELLKSVTFKNVTREEIGAPELHAEITGSCDYLGETEEDVLLRGRELLSFLPSNCREKPPIVVMGDDPNRKDESLFDIVPLDNSKPFDMHEVIIRLLDNGHFLELKPAYAKNMITGLGRIGGRSVGIVANNPQVLDGFLDLRSSEKQARFVRYCDAFNIPLIFLVDTPGYNSNINDEHEGFARHAAMATFAVCEATVPKFTVFIRRCYGSGHMAMGSRLMGIDMIFAWPNADIQSIEFPEAIKAVYRKPLEEISETEVQNFRMKYFNSPLNAGALLVVDDIINPIDTRSVLYDALEITAKKKEIWPEKKHGNIPF
jgi:methylmalonyl-CoA decarboxylase subunit alpha